MEPAWKRTARIRAGLTIGTVLWIGFMFCVWVLWMLFELGKAIAALLPMLDPKIVTVLLVSLVFFWAGGILYARTLK